MVDVQFVDQTFRGTPSESKKEQRRGSFAGHHVTYHHIKTRTHIHQHGFLKPTFRRRLPQHFSSQMDTSHCQRCYSCLCWQCCIHGSFFKQEHFVGAFKTLLAFRFLSFVSRQGPRAKSMWEGERKETNKKKDPIRWQPMYPANPQNLDTRVQYAGNGGPQTVDELCCRVVVRLRCV